MISKVTDEFSMFAQSAHGTQNLTSGTVTNFINVQLKNRFSQSSCNNKPLQKVFKKFI